MQIRGPLFQRLYSRIKHNPDNGCWEYAGYRNRLGYGRLCRGAPSFAPVLAHRAAWELARGPIPEGMCVLHRCDNPACCHVGHLFLGTRLDNNRDRDRKGRNNPLHGEEHYCAKLTEAQVFAIRKDARQPSIIAAEYGCTSSHIGNIKSGRKWGWLEPPTTKAVEREAYA